MAVSSNSHSSDWQQTILALEAEGRHAFLARDFERLDQLWSDELLVHSPVNRIHTKQQTLALLKAGTIAHTSVDARIETVVQRQDLAVVMGGERVINAPDTPAISRRFTDIWRLENGSWRMLVRHANITA